MKYRGITVFQINEQIKAFMWHHNMLKDLFADIICSKQTVSQKTTMMAKSPERIKFNRLCTYNIVDFELVVHAKRKSNVSTTTNIAFSTGFSMANVKFNMQRKMYNQYQNILIYMRSIHKLGHCVLT